MLKTHVFRKKKNMLHICNINMKNTSKYILYFNFS